MDTKTIQNETSAKIAELNDEFRATTFNYLITPGIQSQENLKDLIEAVRRFADFNEDNDPMGEHDFGKIDWRGQDVFWKIDYYDQALKAWCDPLSPDCNRVITVLLAEEY